MNSAENCSVMLELTCSDDYRAIQFIIARTALRPVSEDWPEWQAGSPRRIIFTFESADAADFAKVVLAEFRPGTR